MISLGIAGSVAFLVALLGTPVWIRFQTARGIGQQIRDDGPSGHSTKAGTPTMGGVTIVAGVVAGYAVSHLRRGTVFTRSGLLVLLAVSGGALVGLADDYLKVRRQRSLGLNKRAKLAGQLVVAGAFAVLGVHWAGVSTVLSVSNNTYYLFDLGAVGWSLWAIFLILAASNGANLTDGLDGLAAGSSAFSFACFVFIGYWLVRHPNYRVVPALDLAAVAIALAGGCIGFLWWNAAPARIFMGDTGSLAIGSGVAALALTLNVHLLLPVIGAIYVVEALSVMIQVFAFQVFHRRVFRIAPIHHHFEMRGWPEITVIVRFWILTGLACALAIALFYEDFLRHADFLRKAGPG